MLVSGPGIAGFSICARCQYRLMIRKYAQQRSCPRKIPHSRQINHAARLSQAQAQAQLLTLHIETFDHVVSEADYKRPLKYDERKIDLYTKDSLGMDSLGRPAEALILRSHSKEILSQRLLTDMEKFGAEDVRFSASEMLDKINAEQGLVGPQGIAENLDNIRSDWASKLQTRDQPTEAEYRALFKILHAGFTGKQLKEYYTPENVEPTDDSDNLDASYSSELYIRTSWIYGTTPFPRTALSRLAPIGRAISARVTEDESTDTQQTHAMGLKHMTKTDVIYKIIRERWRFRRAEDEEALGEIDIRLRPEHVSLLENHNQGIMTQLSKRYGAQFSTFVTPMNFGVVRVTGSRDHSYDFVNSLVHLLKRMRHQTVVLPREPRKIQRDIKLESSRDRLHDPGFIQQLQHITNTGIEITPSSSNSSGVEKVIIHYLGPAEDDFIDAKRLLLQFSDFSRPRFSTANYGASLKIRAIAPVPVNVEDSLPLAESCREWSRWTRTIARSSDTGETLKSRDFDDDIALGNVLQALEKRHKLKHPSTIKRNLRIPEPAHWIHDMVESQSVIIGRVIYPTKIVEKLAISGSGKASQGLSATFLKSLDGSRAFLTSNNCLQSSFLSTDNSETTQQEHLLIRLKPKQHESSSASGPAESPDSKPSAQMRLPDLEIRLDIDREQRRLTPVQTHLIFMTRESDLLLPHLSSDVKFVTEQYMNAPPDLDPAISAFITSSTLDLSGSRRWGIPPSLTLSVPMYASEKVGDLSNGSDETGQRPPVEYMYTALEHRTQLLEERDGFQYDCTVIEGGRFGGRREEFRIRIIAPSKNSPEAKRPLSALFDKASQLIVDVDEKNRGDRMPEVLGPKVKPTKVGLRPGVPRRGTADPAKKRKKRKSLLRNIKKIPFGAKDQRPLEQDSDNSHRHDGSVPPVDVPHG